MASFYIHIPFCLSRCLYCDFVSGIPPTQELKAAYTETLIREINFIAHRYPRQEKLSSIYFGGGTPSLLSSSHLKSLLSKLQETYEFSADIEITLEANPEDITKAMAENWKQIGINRISLGFQSMEPHILKILGRRNTPESNLRAWDFLRSSGFQNISLDFILSVQGEDIKTNFQTIRKLKPEHISGYLLSLEKGTVLTHLAQSGNYKPTEDRQSNQTYRAFCRFLETEGYRHYEISNFARNNCYSRHNLNYWEGGEYLAIGIGASGFIKQTSNKGFRWGQTSDLKAYLQTENDFDTLYDYQEELEPNTLLKEALMLGLRQIHGISISNFQYRFGINLFDVFQALPSSAQTFIKYEDGFFGLTPQGILVSNSIIREVWEAVDHLHNKTSKLTPKSLSFKR